MTFYKSQVFHVIFSRYNETIYIESKAARVPFLFFSVKGHILQFTGFLACSLRFKFSFTPEQGISLTVFHPQQSKGEAQNLGGIFSPAPILFLSAAAWMILPSQLNHFSHCTPDIQKLWGNYSQRLITFVRAISDLYGIHLSIYPIKYPTRQLKMLCGFLHIFRRSQTGMCLVNLTLLLRAPLIWMLTVCMDLIVVVHFFLALCNQKQPLVFSLE